MPDNADKARPAHRSVRVVIPPFKAIIKEGTEEIKRQANDLVERTLESPTAVDPKILRKWGEDGARYFFKRLKARVSDQVGAAAAARRMPRGANVKSSVGHHGIPAKAAAIVAKTRSAIWPRKAPAPKSAKAPFVAVKNWQAQQRDRLSYVAVATLRGLLVALLMTVGAIILLRLMA
ncbi:hypothetical protein IVB33_33045 [Bradyrhizobium sp. 24]|uniref:hypothetical protein n=1 Tax=unclassified Bradyrhizobium TaxID=2631580 RepID=UPI001FFA995E|nr:MULTISPECIES: hypothetical protein [unclassified Bradyrhizobium]MCK1299686.1 hypothetical protein [Bradyrhizobium sp. 37]MCK1381558.1 hypothetical protein [Bradyrhizobium sp. 24]MCK1768644.1 hypothetical protein [Bradyrhizobium sp. 134]